PPPGGAPAPPPPRRIGHWPSPVTVSLAVQRDRSMITHSHPSPVPDNQLIHRAPSTAAGGVHLGQDVPDWVPAARQNGTLLFGDVGWDATEQWSTRTLEQ